MKYLLICALFLTAAPSFAAPVSCQSIDENVGGGNIRITIGSLQNGTDMWTGKEITFYPVTIVNESEGISKKYSGFGSVSPQSVELTLVTGGDMAVGTITAKYNRKNGMLNGNVNVQEVQAPNEMISCVAAQ